MEQPFLPHSWATGSRGGDDRDDIRGHFTSTAAHASIPATPTRTIETTIVYPAQGTPGSAVTSNAPVDMSGMPLPLVVLSHGLGASIEYMTPLAEVWAARMI